MASLLSLLVVNLRQWLGSSDSHFSVLPGGWKFFNLGQILGSVKVLPVKAGEMACQKDLVLVFFGST